MKTVPYVALALLAWLLCAIPARSQTVFDIFGAVDGQGADPLVDSYPFFLFPNHTRTALIIFQSDDYEGTVTLQVTCCTDMSGVAGLPPGGLKVEPVGETGNQHFVPAIPSSPKSAHPAPLSLGPNQFFTHAHEVHKVGLKVTADSDPNVMVGRFTAKVDASKSDGSSASTQVIINVLPTMRDTPTPSCAAFTTDKGSSTVPSGFATAGATLIPADETANAAPVFDMKRSNPSTVSWGFGDDMRGAGGQNIGLSKSIMPPLTPTTAKFVFYNITSGDKQYVLFNTLTCTPTTTFSLSTGQRATVVANATMTKTILFRKTDDGKTWENISILSAGPFWTLFGGREVDFQWFDGSENNVYGCYFC
jgi:hypothetical protein